MNERKPNLLYLERKGCGAYYFYYIETGCQQIRLFFYELAS